MAEPVPVETLLYVARLSKHDRDQTFRHDRFFPGSDLRNRLLAAKQDVCIDRLIRAEGCLRIARQLSRRGDDERWRASVSRAYYSVHHSIRVICLWENGWAPDGHQESISEIAKLLIDNAVRGRSGLTRDIVKQIGEARDNRHVADYSPYKEQRSDRGNENITQNDWRAAATFNIDLAKRLLKAATKIVGS